MSFLDYDYSTGNPVADRLSRQLHDVIANDDPWRAAAGLPPKSVDFTLSASARVPKPELDPEALIAAVESDDPDAVSTLIEKTDAAETAEPWNYGLSAQQQTWVRSIGGGRDSHSQPAR